MSELRVPFGNTLDFQDWDSMVVARERLLTEGWEAVPWDSPERGVRAFACTRSGEPRTLLRWMMFSRELSPVVKVCGTWEEFVRELEFRAKEEMDKCDDVPAGQVGFASYGRAPVDGTCEVFRIPVAVLTAGGPEARARLMAVLKESVHPGAEALRRIRPSPPPSSSSE